MKPDYTKMSIPELSAYALSHREDMDAIRALFYHPDLKYKEMPPMFTADGEPIEENIQLAEAALRQRIEAEDRKRHSQD